MQTEVIRCAPGARRRSQATTSGWPDLAPSPPGTTTVCASCTVPRSASGTRVSPLDERTGAPPGPATTIRYAGPGAPWPAR